MKEVLNTVLEVLSGLGVVNRFSRHTMWGDEDCLELSSDSLEKTILVSSKQVQCWRIPGYTENSQQLSIMAYPTSHRYPVKYFKILEAEKDEEVKNGFNYIHRMGFDSDEKLGEIQSNIINYLEKSSTNNLRLMKKYLKLTKIPTEFIYFDHLTKTVDIRYMNLPEIGLECYITVQIIKNLANGEVEMTYTIRRMNTTDITKLDSRTSEVIPSMSSDARPIKEIRELDEIIKNQIINAVFEIPDLYPEDEELPGKLLKMAEDWKIL